MQRVARNDRNNEILWNYTKKEDQLMSAAFGTQPKRRLNRVMDTLNFKYPDYERLDKGAKGIKRKMIVSILSRQADRLVKKDEKVLKKSKIAPEPKATISKNRKLDTSPSSEPTVDETGEEAPLTPSAAEPAEILNVMTESPPFKLLSPLGSELTNFFRGKNSLRLQRRKLKNKRSYEL
jgi:hypothetical protein